jgi:hypothetical protein
MTRLSFAAFCAAILVVGSGLAHWKIGTEGPKIGFQAPEGLPRDVARRANFSEVALGNPAHLEEVMSAAEGTGHVVDIDLGLTIAIPKRPEQLSITYTTDDGVLRTKQFAPLTRNAMRFFPNAEDLERTLKPFMPILLRHRRNLGRDLRSIFARYGLHDIELGVIFANGMFAPEFAEMMSREASEYARGIDAYYLENRENQSKEFQRWLQAISTNRLVTYDMAGNMYTGGGLPEGYDVFAFDYYVSTMLMDRLLDGSLIWLASKHLHESCDRFEQENASTVRGELSFFTGPDKGLTEGGDRLLLDQIFDCRMRATTKMLENAIAAAGLEKAALMLVGESSENGFMDFTAPSDKQPRDAIERRMLDEVKRYDRFYMENPDRFSAGLMYFTYESAYDAGIDLNVGGASAVPAVLGYILSRSGG